MNAEQKFALAKLVIVLTTIAIITICMAWLVVSHEPTSMKATIDLQSSKIDFDCTFIDKNE
jgi:hypothetical protein